MERRNLYAGLLVLAISSFLMVGTAFAHKTPAKKGKKEAVVTSICKVKSDSGASFIDQGEFSEASSVAAIIEVECNPEYAGQTVKLSAQELYARCRDNLSWSVPYPLSFVEGPTYKVTLDNDGNATAAVWGGPGCAAGESLISAHLEEAPYETVTTAFTVLAPRTTPPGVSVLPAAKVEDDVDSSVATIVEIEFPSVYAEKFVNINAEQLYSRCLVSPHLMWVGPDEHVVGDGETLSKVKLDNDGNAFVVLLGGASCASGPSEIEASLEQAPYTTFTTTFTVDAPEVTEF